MNRLLRSSGHCFFLAFGFLSCFLFLFFFVLFTIKRIFVCISYQSSYFVCPSGMFVTKIVVRILLLLFVHLFSSWPVSSLLLYLPLVSSRPVRVLNESPSFVIVSSSQSAGCLWFTHILALIFVGQNSGDAKAKATILIVTQMEMHNNYFNYGVHVGQAGMASFRSAQ